MELETYPTLYIQINSKWTNGINIRAKTINILEEYTGEILHYIGNGDDFWTWHQKHRNQEKKLDILDVIKI